MNLLPAQSSETGAARADGARKTRPPPRAGSVD